ncbi:MAG: hypothetical protein SVY53_00885 [Chloroflexota bacterium]|nr:hypothetical protein [Chloroflexota bacterium]
MNLSDKYAHALSRTPLKQSTFIMSLDTELAWGFLLHPKSRALTSLQNDPSYGRDMVTFLLRLLEKYYIPATWAIVGHLFLKPGEGRPLISKDMASFKENWLDWEFYNNYIAHSPLYCGGDIIERILSCRVSQEIGLHSFFHLPLPQCSKQVVTDELEIGVKLAREKGIAPRSFVFPGNDIKHIDILESAGFQSYRGKNLPRWNLLNTINSSNPPKKKHGLWEVPSSICFVDPLLPSSLLPRARILLSNAIRKMEVFHVFLHPHNLLTQPSLAKYLDQFLGTVARKRDEGKLQVMTMQQLATQLDSIS